MSDDAHSPGPWCSDGTRIDDAGGRVVARVVVAVDDRWQANARLIADAPETKAERDELLALVREFTKHSICLDQANSPCGKCWPCRADAMLDRIDGKLTQTPDGQVAGKPQDQQQDDEQGGRRPAPRRAYARASDDAEQDGHDEE